MVRIHGVSRGNSHHDDIMQTKGLDQHRPSKQQWRDEKQSVVVLARENTDFERGLPALLIRGVPKVWLFPLFHYETLTGGLRRMGVPNVLSCSERGKVYRRPDRIESAQVELLERMGIEAFSACLF